MERSKQSHKTREHKRALRRLFDNFSGVSIAASTREQLIVEILRVVGVR